MKKIISTILLSSLSAFVFGQSITLDPKSTAPASLVIKGDLALQKIQRETGSGGYNDYNRQNASIVVFENGGTLGGVAGGSEGQMFYVVSGYGNAQSALVIRHDSPLNPTANNRILTHTGADFTIPSGLGGVLLIYDATKARWRVVETPSGSGSTGWGLTGNGGTNPASNFIGTTDAQGFVVKTNGLERISIESGGDVGIGITTADSKLHVAKGSAGSVTAFGSSIATFENSTHGYLNILTPATSEAGILFGSPTSNLRGYLAYNHNTDKMSFGTANTTRMTIDGTGNIGIGSTNPLEKLHVSGNGIITGNVGIGTFSPNAKLEVAGTYAISGKTTFTGTQHNYNLGGKSVIHVNGSTALLTGIAGGVDGLIVHIYAGINTDLTIADQSTSSLVANRITTGNSGDITIIQGGGATLIYDADVSAWRVIGIKF